MSITYNKHRQRLNVFGQCSMNVQEHRQTKNEIQQECMGNTSNAKLHPPDNGLYHRSSNIQDNRMVWATLTPRGTQHFISENYPANIVDFVENEDHYEIIDNYNIQPVLTSQSPAYHTYLKGLALVKLGRNKTYNDASFTDYEYEDPTPLIESYQMNDIETKHSGHFSTLTNADMRCMTDSTLRRGFSFRPCVSSPTRIEHPNLPPLNLYPYNTLKTTSINYKNVDSASLPRYGC